MPSLTFDIVGCDIVEFNFDLHKAGFTDLAPVYLQKPLHCLPATRVLVNTKEKLDPRLLGRQGFAGNRTDREFYQEFVGWELREAKVFNKRAEERAKLFKEIRVVIKFRFPNEH